MRAVTSRGSAGCRRARRIPPAHAQSMTWRWRTMTRRASGRLCLVCLGFRTHRAFSRRSHAFRAAKVQSRSTTTTMALVRQLLRQLRSQRRRQLRCRFLSRCLSVRSTVTSVVEIGPAPHLKTIAPAILATPRMVLRALRLLRLPLCRPLHQGIQRHLCAPRKPAVPQAALVIRGSTSGR